MGLRPATPSRSCRRAGPRPRPAALDRARGADGDPLAAAPLPLPVRTTTPAAIVSGAESTSPERDDRISSCPQAAATGSRLVASASALSIVLVSGLAPRVIWTVLGF